METTYKDGSLGRAIKGKRMGADPIPSANNVIDMLRPLAEFYRVNQKSVDRIAVDAATWKRVEKMADDPKESRIHRHMDGYPMYGVYELYLLQK